MLTLNDGRRELYQWDTGRKLSVAVDCTQVHYSNKIFGRSIDVDVVDGIAIIPDILLQTDKDLTAWAFVGTPENGYTKISKTFRVNRRNKPADYVFTPPEQTTLGELVERLQKIEETQDPDAIKNAVEDYLDANPVEAPVQSVNGKKGEVQLTAKDVGAISQDDLQEATNKALAQAKASGEFKGDPGEPGKDGADGSPGKDGYTPQKGIDYFDGTDGQDGRDGYTPVKGVDYFDGAPGEPGAKGDKGDPGNTPYIGTNGNWWIGDEDTGVSAGGTGGTGETPTVQKQADWNQNDETAPDYVKNRPFYTGDQVETVLIEEQTISVGDDLYALCSGKTTIEVGKTYIVNFNGARYKCVAYRGTNDFEGAAIIGNGDIIGIDGGDGEPFAFDSYVDGRVYLDTAETGEYTVSIIGIVEVHKIDEKYLPTAFVVDITGDGNGGWTADKTLDEVASAWLSARKVIFSIEQSGDVLNYEMVMLTNYVYNGGYQFYCYWGNVDGTGFKLQYSRDGVEIYFGANPVLSAT